MHDVAAVHHVGPGAVGAVVTNSRDVTERKSAEAALRASETRYRLAARATSDAIWEWDLLGGQVEWNEGVQTLFGYAAADVAPTADWWLERIHPDDHDRVVAGIRAHRTQADEIDRMPADRLPDIFSSEHFVIAWPERAAGAPVLGDVCEGLDPD